MRLMPQRAGGDCGIAALATYLEMAYEDVYVAASEEDRARRGKSGMEAKRLLRISSKLGAELRLHKNSGADLDNREGLLMVKWRRPVKGFSWHVVALDHGVVADPADGFILAVDEYLLRFKCKAGDVLERVR